VSVPPPPLCYGVVQTDRCVDDGCRLTQQGVNRLVRSLQTDFFAHPAMQSSAHAQPVIAPLPKDRPFVHPRDFLYPLLSQEEKQSSPVVVTTTTVATATTASNTASNTASTTTTTNVVNTVTTTKPVAQREP
jgi:hypothetical protein